MNFYQLNEHIYNEIFGLKRWKQYQKFPQNPTVAWKITNEKDKSSLYEYDALDDVAKQTVDRLLEDPMYPTLKSALTEFKNRQQMRGGAKDPRALSTIQYYQR